MRYCTIIPTYNNSKTVADVVERTLAVCRDVIVVNDGSTDGTEEVLKGFGERVRLVSYKKNRGKGYALRQGFLTAKKAGYTHAVSIDSDGQHNPSDIALLLSAAQAEGEEVLIVGSRNLNAEGMPSGNSFANRFSNFWFTLQTAHKLPDTQTGFRLYPLESLPPLCLMTNRYESELMLLVLSAWRGVRLVPVKVGVEYPPDRVSHFRRGADFFRISVLNAVLCIVAVVYGYPRMLLRKIAGGRR